MDKLKSKDFWKAALVRALRTFCQAAIAEIGTAKLIADVNWEYMGSAAFIAALVSLLTSILTGLPEVDYGQELLDENKEL